MVRLVGREGRLLAIGTVVYLLARPLLALAHELCILLSASLLGALGTFGSSATLSGAMPLDPVYTTTMFLLLSDVKVLGVAVDEPIGGLLRALWPSTFAESALVTPGAWASAVIEPGASVIARQLTHLGGDLALLTAGLLLVRLGLVESARGDGEPGAEQPVQTRRRLVGGASIAVVFGALLQADTVVNQIADKPLTLPELEATGLTYGFSVLFSGPATERPRLSTLLLALPDPLRDGLFVSGAILVNYLLAIGIVLGLTLTWRIARAARTRHGEWLEAGAGASRSQPVRWSSAPLGLGLFALTVVSSPVGTLADADSHYLGEGVGLDAAAGAEPIAPLEVETAAIEPLNVTPPMSPPPPDTAGGPDVAQPAPARPTIVSVSGSLHNYVYQVNGGREVIQGMGYNPVYRELPAGERAARLDRDFARMKRAGVNTILGWETEEFDRALLDRAEAHGLGVILPYHLDPALDYTSAEVRAAVRRDVLEWVDRYRDHPALRMWGLGNEVLHKLVHPSWMTFGGDPALEARAEAFVHFFVELIDEVHQLDPDHPITHRDAEEAYLPRLRDALNQTGRHRAWFVYGINIYTPRLAEVIEAWPTLGLDAPLLISEFGPGGAGPKDRPRGYQELWTMIRSQPDRVLGGAPYVWTTEGPEEVDRIFGLVDREGQPVDGSLVAIGRLYRGELARRAAGAGGSGRLDCHHSRPSKAYLQADAEQGSCS